MITELPLKLDKDNNTRFPVTITNPKNNKTIKLDILPDTGASKTFLDTKYGRMLGVTAGSGRTTTTVSTQGVGTNAPGLGINIVDLVVKVGTLKPVTTPVSILTGEANFEIAVMGNYTFLQFKKVTFTGTNRIRFEDDTPSPAVVKKQAAYAYAYYSQPSWQRRI